MQVPLPCDTTPELLRVAAAEFGSAAAVVRDDLRLTFRELEQDSRLLARGLMAKGVNKGGRIGIWMGNGPQWVTSSMAVSRCGGIAVPLSTTFRGAELHRMIRHADLEGLLFDAQFMGIDFVERLFEAIPSLIDEDLERIAVAGLPGLRWIATTGDPRGEYESRIPRIQEIASLALTKGFDDELLRGAETDVHPGDTAIMIMTSGSTADPKGVPHTHAALMTQGRYVSQKLQFDRDTRSFTDLPYFWVGGLILSLVPALLCGGSAFSMERFDPTDLLRLVERERITRVHLTARHLREVETYPDRRGFDTSSIKFGPEVLTGEPWRIESEPSATSSGRVMGLGMSETLGPYWWGVPTTDDVSDALGQNPGALAKQTRFLPPPLDLGELPPGFDLEVRDQMGAKVAFGQQGEICVRGATVTRCLYKTSWSHTFHADGYMKTGDSALVDDLGQIWFTGRMSEMIKSSGANVAPAEVAATILSVAGVSDAFVVGVPNAHRGQEVAAVVVRGDDGSVTEEDLRRYFCQLIELQGAIADRVY